MCIFRINSFKTHKKIKTSRGPMQIVGPVVIELKKTQQDLNFKVTLTDWPLPRYFKFSFSSELRKCLLSVKYRKIRNILQLFIKAVRFCCPP